MNEKDSLSWFNNNINKKASHKVSACLSSNFNSGYGEDGNRDAEKIKSTPQDILKTSNDDDNMPHFAFDCK